MFGVSTALWKIRDFLNPFVKTCIPPNVIGLALPFRRRRMARRTEFAPDNRRFKGTLPLGYDGMEDM